MEQKTKSEFKESLILQSSKTSWRHIARQIQDGKEIYRCKIFSNVFVIKEQPTAAGIAVTIGQKSQAVYRPKNWVNNTEGFFIMNSFMSLKKALTTFPDEFLMLLAKNGYTMIYEPSVRIANVWYSPESYNFMKQSFDVNNLFGHIKLYSKDTPYWDGQVPFVPDKNPRNIYYKSVFTLSEYEPDEIEVIGFEDGDMFSIENKEGSIYDVLNQQAIITKPEEFLVKIKG